MGRLETKNKHVMLQLQSCQNKYTKTLHKNGKGDRITMEIQVEKRTTQIDE